MEPVARPRRILATKISYISHIMVYFGYIHECAELYRRLGRDSRHEWNSKAACIFKVIMRHRDSRLRMQIKKSFTRRNAEFLLRDGVYNYFSLGIGLNHARTYETEIKFLESLEEYAPFLFFEVSLKIHTGTYDIANKFGKKTNFIHSQPNLHFF